MLLKMDTEFLRFKYEDSHDGVITKTKFKIGIRHIQIIYMFMSSVVMGAMRGSTGVGILAISDMDHNSSYIEMHNWSQRIQGLILSSYFFGYALFLIPAEVYLAQFGEKLVLTAVLLINGSMSAAMPTIVNKGGWIATCNTQFLLGMTQACITPVNQKLITNWLPPHERSTFNCIVQGGLILGIMIGLPISGLISEARLGWELVFYSQAMMTFSMAVIWGLLTASRPDKHKAVGDWESEFIKETSKFYRKKTLKNPWRRVLRTRQFWAIAGSHAVSNAIFIFFLVNIPAYLKGFQLPLYEVTFQVMLAFASLCLVYILTAPSLDWAYRIGIVDHFFDIRYLRKLVNGLGMIGLVTGLILIPNSIPGNQWTVFLMMITLSSLSLQYSGFLENHKDMSQNFSGTLLVMTSAVAGVVGAFVPLMTGMIVVDVTDQTCWRIMYFILAALVIVSGIFYTAFGESDRQFWDDGLKNKYGYTNETTNLELDEFESNI
ncbi:putative inorganic phosphate cotransporter [Pieris napi]|uniref:putative inorganic phosphate cotransporter n=1 Tax=Pieris napi TaxID=78633 RepID=UPI001FB868C3|nr:putative inorganic phosphate cotransporter [Pieris napi]